MSQSTSTRPPRKSVVGRPRFGAYLVAGAVGGFLAGAAFIALNAWFATSNGMPRMQPFRTVATIVQGQVDVNASNVAIGIVLHVAISIVLGLIFALVTAGFRSAIFVAFAGLVFGAVVYVVDFQVLARQVGQFSAFRMTNQPFEAAAHLVFGAVLAVLVLIGARRDRGLREVPGATTVDDGDAPTRTRGDDLGPTREAPSVRRSSDDA